MRGIIARVLISRPIQASSQCVLVSVIEVPRTSPNRRIIKIKGFISRGRSLTYIFGAWAQELV